MKGANNRCPRSVIDNREDLTDRERACPSREEGKLGSAIDGHAVGYDFVCLGVFGLQFVNIGRVIVEDEWTLNGKCSWFLYSLARGQKRSRPAISPDRHRPGDDPAAAQG